jgi:endonuclease/exonuclease/phosphatase family metal-dependent hydrolase
MFVPLKGQNAVLTEQFFKVELPTIFPLAPTVLLLAGDFNCILDARDTTSSALRSSALERLTKGLRLQDVWDAASQERGFTHYAPQSASRLDRIYVTEQLYREKLGWRKL